MGGNFELCHIGVSYVLVSYRLDVCIIKCFYESFFSPCKSDQIVEIHSCLTYVVFIFHWYGGILIQLGWLGFGLVLLRVER